MTKITNNNEEGHLKWFMCYIINSFRILKLTEYITILKEFIVSYFKVLFCNWSWNTEDNHKREGDFRDYIDTWSDQTIVCIIIMLLLSRVLLPIQGSQVWF